MAHAVNVGLSGQLQQDAHIVGPLFASTANMIGSGWLFGARYACRFAGRLSIWIWVVGAAIIKQIALCFTELAALIPQSEALVHRSHARPRGRLGRVWSCLLFLSYVAVPTAAAAAVVTCANIYLPYFIRPGGEGLLTVTGFVSCAALLVVFAWLNLLAPRAPLPGVQFYTANFLRDARSNDGQICHNWRAFVLKAQHFRDFA